MIYAIFNITNSTLNLAVSLAIFILVVLWLSMVVYTFLDARRRIADPFLVGCATVAALFPLIGTAVYAILRPPELLADVEERELEIEAAELRVRQLKANSCPHCGYPTERNFMRCPNCERRLKDPCTSCERPVDPRWAICPYCETPLPGRRRESRSSKGSSKPARSKALGGKGSAGAKAADSEEKAKARSRANSGSGEASSDAPRRAASTGRAPGTRRER